VLEHPQPLIHSNTLKAPYPTPPCTQSKEPQRNAPEPTQTPRRRESILDIARSRTGWLVAFCVGLLLAALVVEQFEGVLEQHVELSFFVPLIMGHGGNTGSQSVTTVIR
jgi:Mg/Co/Ni transporter MgtE